MILDGCKDLEEAKRRQQCKLDRMHSASAEFTSVAFDDYHFDLSIPEGKDGLETFFRKEQEEKKNTERAARIKQLRDIADTLEQGGDLDEAMKSLIPGAARGLNSMLQGIFQMGIR